MSNIIRTALLLYSIYLAPLLPLVRRKGKEEDLELPEAKKDG